MLAPIDNGKSFIFLLISDSLISPGNEACKRYANPLSSCRKRTFAGMLRPTLDHWPLRAEFELEAVAPAPTRAELLERVETLEWQMLELKTLIQRLP
jgi:hypothetical protein